MPALDSLLTFAVASLALLLIPGPAVLYIINRSVTDGRNVAIAAVAGLEIGNFVHVLAATVGLSAVIAASATAFNVIKWVGAGYLVYVGARTLMRRPAEMNQTVAGASLKRSFTQGIVVNIFNPKVGLFFLSFLPQFIDTNRGSAALQSLILGATFVAIGLTTDMLYALTASALRDKLLRGKSLPFIQRYISGTIFIALGVVAGSASRN